MTEPSHETYPPPPERPPSQGSFFRRHRRTVLLAAALTTAVACDPELTTSSTPTSVQAPNPSAASGTPPTAPQSERTATQTGAIDIDAIAPLDKDVAGKVLSATVSVQVYTMHPDLQTNQCTGVHLGNGYIGTADHCVSIFVDSQGNVRDSKAEGLEGYVGPIVVSKGAQRFLVSRTFPAIEEDPPSDVRLLKVDNPGILAVPHLDLAPQPQLSRGETGLLPTILTQVHGVETVYRSTFIGIHTDDGDTFQRFVAKVDPTATVNSGERGDSGAPIANTRGQVIGILSRRSSGELLTSDTYTSANGLVDEPDTRQISECWGISADELKKLYP